MAKSYHINEISRVIHYIAYYIKIYYTYIDFRDRNCYRNAKRKAMSRRIPIIITETSIYGVERRHQFDGISKAITFLRKERGCHFPQGKACKLRQGSLTVFDAEQTEFVMEELCIPEDVPYDYSINDSEEDY